MESVDLKQLVAVGLAGLVLSFASSFALGGRVEAEEARPIAPVAPDSGPCSKVEVEKALQGLDVNALLKATKTQPDEENNWATLFGWTVGRFLDPSCHVAMVAVGREHVGYTNTPEAVFLKLEKGRLTFVKRLPISEVGCEFPVGISEVVDFDHDGRDEVVMTEDMGGSGDPDDPDLDLRRPMIYYLLDIRGSKLETLWNYRDPYRWAAGEYCRSKTGPCDVGSIELSFVDLDGDGIDEVVLHSKRATYRDPEHTKLVSNDEKREVFWFNGTWFDSRRPVATTGSSPAKASALSTVPAGALARFQARLSQQDHVNNQTGAALKFAAQVIRQDRVSYHVSKLPDPEDTADPLYSSAGARTTLTGLLEKAISPTENDRIMKGTPLVDVTVWPDRAEFLILSE